MNYLSYQDKYLSLELYGAPVLEVCKARGVDENKLLRGTGIFKTDIVHGKLANPKQVLKLLANAESLTPGYDCAFQIGRRLAANQQHCLMQALHQTRSFAESMRIAAVFENLCSPFLSASYFVEKGFGYWLLREKVGLGKLNQFITETFCTALVSLSQHVMGHRLKFHFGFQWKQPKYIQEYEENLGYRNHFSQACNLIAIDLTLLEKSSAKRNDLYKWHSLHQSKKLAYRAPVFLELIRGMIKKYPNECLANIATRVDMSSATLKRKLKEHSHSFKQLQDEVKKHQAIHCLLLMEMNNQQSAITLHIDDLTNFRRAIKRWTGKTPTELKYQTSFLPLSSN